MANSLNILEKLISFDTTSSVNTFEAVEYIKKYLEEKGIKTHLVYTKDKKRASLLATVGDESKPGIILSGHLDTVPSIREEWNTDPFCLTEKDGKLYGRGTSDMKGAIACALGNIDYLKSTGKTFHLVFTHEEECGFEAIKQLFAEDFDNFFKVKPIGCIVMEPTLLEPICGHKGAFFATIKVTGKESHSAYPHLGVDAIAYLVKIYNKIQTVFNEYSKKFAIDSAYTPNQTTLGICRLSGGDAANKIAGSAELIYGMRYLAQDDIASFNNEIKAFCEELKKEIKTQAEEADVAYIENLNVKGFETDINSDFVKMFDNPSKVSYATEAGYFQTLGINTVVFGPGSIEQAHTKNEFIEKSQIEAFDKFLQTL